MPAPEPGARSRRARWIIAALLALALLLLKALVLLRPAAPVPARARGAAAALRDYQEVFPLYAEVCASTQIEKLPGHGRAVTGNRFGHGGLYLHGACRDASAGFPLLRPCAPGDAERGAGVSTDYAYQSVSWVASPSRSFFERGDLPPGARFGWEQDLTIQAAVISAGMFTGVTPSAAALAERPAGAPLQPFLLDDNFGTDYAVDLARSSSCVRLPLTAAMLAQVIAFLNGLNQFAQAHGNPFSGLGNNCAHTWHNALASIDVWPPLRTDRRFPLNLLELAIPYNQLAGLLQRADRLPLEEPAALLADAQARAMLERWGRLPAGPGVLLVEQAIEPDNQVYDTSARPLFLDGLGLLGRERALVAARADPAWGDLRANLLSWRARLARLAAARAARPAAPEGGQMHHFLVMYDGWVDGQRAEVEAALARLDAREPVAPAAQLPP